jgi:2-dehydro-3-deoxy-L-rhamnonate dehydrogenase (NAD+)
MTKPLDGQTAIVTGAAKGIGLGIAQRLAKDGCKVVLWDLDYSPIDETATDLSEALRQTVDVADLSSVEGAFDDLEKNLGRVDILVNNAGINGPVCPAWEYPTEAWHRVLAVDLTGVFYCCRAIVPHMRERRYGRIVNIASIAGKEGMPGISAYAAAKAGVIGFTKSLARELAESGVLVNCVAPVITQTELFSEMTAEHIASSKSRIPMGRFCTVPEIAALVAWIASPECSFTTGFVFDISGGRATY